MSEEPEYFATQQQRRVLAIFPKRTISCIKFDRQKVSKLLKYVECPLCNSILVSPVYLRCSHRFCKECLEKYIRRNESKSCPKCPGELCSKRQLKLDMTLASLINYAFGNAKKVNDELQHSKDTKGEIKQKNMSNSKRNRSRHHEKQLSESESEVKKKIVINLQQSENSAPKALIKSSPKHHKIQGLHSPQAQNDKNSKSTEELSTPVQCRPSKKLTVKLTPYPKCTTPNQQKQSNEEICQEERGNQKYNKKDKETSIKQVKQPIKRKSKTKAESATPLPTSNTICTAQPSPHVIQALHTTQATLHTAQAVSTIKQDINSPRASLTIENGSKISELSLQQTTDRESLEARQLMKSYFQQNYMHNLIQASTIKCVLGIRLKVHPHCFVTPLIGPKSVYMSLNAQVSDLCRILSSKLNIDNSNAIKIYAEKVLAKNDQPRLSEITEIKKTILEINDTYWNSYSGLWPFDSESLQKLLGDTREPNRNWRVLYYRVDRDRTIKK